MTVRALVKQFHAYTKGVDTQDPHLDDMPDQVRTHSPPSRQGKIMNICSFYHGAHSFSLFSVSWSAPRLHFRHKRIR
ncbi:hypothetical protein SMD44_05479 [Streptomyces alboflavus]|uniref:Uncharacterized protein n=1 Tax=Streptomyces alboflavus TaxID=67267 RepID=A0A1Z1WHZ3_9ACTN|nr:hypothetical protein SMD44_05479 [Streptomyces alboflavus]